MIVGSFFWFLFDVSQIRRDTALWIAVLTEWGKDQDD